MMKFIILVLMICYTGGSPSNNIDDLVDNIFKRDTVSTTRNTGIPGECKCVKYYLCINGTVNRYGEGLIDYRINSGTDKVCEYIEECCKVPEESKQIDSTSFRLPSEKLQKCGVRNSEGIGFQITGGKDNKAKLGEFPWMLALLEEEKALLLFTGGASLIHPQVALTAAHLVFNKKNKFKIRAGEWDAQTKSEIIPHQDHDIVAIKVHPEFDFKTAFNDFALLFLNASFKISENVDVVCLPASNTKVEAGTRCFTGGWGKDQYGKSGRYQPILKKEDVPVVTNEDCQSRLRNDGGLGEDFQLHNSFMCAGGESTEDACKGDGGGPLVCPVLNHPGIYEQYGVVSWGIKCGNPKLPGVYAAVSKVVDWIEKELTSYKLDIPYNKS